MGRIEKKFNKKKKEKDWDFLVCRWWKRSRSDAAPRHPTDKHEIERSLFQRVL